MNGRKLIASLVFFGINVSLVQGTSAQEYERRDLGLEWEIAEVLREDAANSDPARKQFAQELFAYYQQHTVSKTGELALLGSFRIWNNFGAIDEIEKVLPLIPRDSPVWSMLLSEIRGVFRRSERPVNAYYDLLRQLERELTNPLSRTEVLAHLSEVDSLAVGQLAPDFTTTTLDGSTLTLSKLRGQVVLLEFWATWCQPCLPEIPKLKSLHANFDERGLQIVGISLDADSNELGRFLLEEGIGWMQVQQRDGIQGQVARLFNVQSIPRSLLLDRQGRIVAKDLRGEALEMAVTELVGLTTE